MKKLSLNVLLVFILTAMVQNNYAQYPDRQDVVWAKMVPAGTIHMDGVLDEAAWASAEEIDVIYGVPGQLPTSAYRPEAQPDVYYDQTNAKVKFLVSDDNQLYLSFYIPDSSIGGNADWARWDGILMSVKNKLDPTRPALATEYFYTWWYVNAAQYLQPGVPPRFVGTYGNFDDTTRTPEQHLAWDAVSKIIGTSNDDSTPDTAWVVEMRVNLNNQGYDITKSEGDVIALNFSIWDGDWIFSGDPFRLSETRTWFQGPWGNSNGMNVARIFGRPDITTATTALPVIAPDVVVPNGNNFSDPVIDGQLDEVVWEGAYSFNIAWDDTLLRQSYPTTGPLSSGQFQPELSGNPAPPVLDPSFANIKMFFKDNYLYLAADLNDQLIQGSSVYDRLDGVRFLIGDRSAVDGDNVMVFRQLRVDFDLNGQPEAQEFLPTLADSGNAQWAVSLKGASTVNNNSDIDEGYKIEMKVDLTKIGYPADLGDKLLFMGVMLADGDSFDDSLANYGTRIWWFREHNAGPSCAWMVLDENTVINVKEVGSNSIPSTFHLIGNYPNPFNPSTNIRYSIPEAGNVTINFFNSIGQEIYSTNFSAIGAGVYDYRFNAENLASGVYFYKVMFKSLSSNIAQRSDVGKMILMK